MATLIQLIRRLKGKRKRMQTKLKRVDDAIFAPRGLRASDWPRAMDAKTPRRRSYPQLGAEGLRRRREHVGRNTVSESEQNSRRSLHEAEDSRFKPARLVPWARSTIISVSIIKQRWAHSWNSVFATPIDTSGFTVIIKMLTKIFKAHEAFAVICLQPKMDSA